MTTCGYNDPRRYQNVYGRVDISGESIVQLGDIILSEDPEKAKYQRLLDSLYFPEIHAREDSISGAHGGTFAWILRTRSGHGSFPVENGVSDAHHLFTASSSPLPPSSRPWISSDHWDPDKIRTSKDAGTFSSPTTSQQQAARKKFTSWMANSSDGHMFWFKGKAGSGKSTLMSYLADHGVDDLLPDPLVAKQKRVIVLSHFFWELGGPLQRNTVGLLRSILWKFFSRYPDLGLPIFSKSRLSSQPAWTRKDLYAELGAIVSQPMLEFRFFIDGLDECVSTDERDSIIALLRRLEHRNNVKLCVSSRPERKYECELQGKPFLRLDEITGSDMEKYATDALSSAMLRVKMNSHIGRLWVAKLVQKLLDKAHGVFVWLRVAVKSLITGLENRDPWEGLLTRLEEMPEDIEQLYLYMLDRGKETLRHYASSAALMFQLLLSNEGSMSLAQFAWAREDVLRREFLNSNLTVSEIDGLLHRLDLETLIIWITSHCANFVELWDPVSSTTSLSVRLSWVDLLKRQVDHDDAIRYGYVGHVGSPQVRFIHKTVGHFLTESIEGRKVMSGCSKTIDSIHTATAEADLVLLLCSVAIRGNLSSVRLSTYVRAITGLERQHELFATGLTCLDRIEFGPQDWDWHHDYLWGYHPLIMVPKCPCAFLFWCVRNNHSEFVFEYVTANSESIPSVIASHLLSTFIRSQMLRACQSSPLTLDKTLLSNGVSTFLRAGANPNSPILFSPSTTCARWDAEVSIASYCVYNLNFPHLITSQAFHVVLHCLLLLLQAGADKHISWPKPLFDMFKSNIVTNFETYCAINEVELWSKVINHYHECEQLDCASSRIRDLVGIEWIKRPQILAIRLTTQWYAIESPAVSDMIWKTLYPNDKKHAHYCGGHSTGLVASHSLGTLSYDGHWPREWPSDILQGCTEIANFRLVLEHIGWTEDEITATFEEPLRTIHERRIEKVAEASMLSQNTYYEYRHRDGIGVEIHRGQWLI